MRKSTVGVQARGEDRGITGISIPIHPHMCSRGYWFKLATDDGRDTSAIQHYTDTRISSIPFALRNWLRKVQRIVERLSGSAMQVLALRKHRGRQEREPAVIAVGDGSLKTAISLTSRPRKSRCTE